MGTGASSIFVWVGQCRSMCRVIRAFSERVIRIGGRLSDETIRNMLRMQLCSAA